MARGQETRSETVGEALDAVEESRETISRDLDVLGSRLEQEKEQIKSKVEAVKERLNVLKPLRDRVRSNPWSSVGIALGTGVAMGVITGWRSRVAARKEAELRERRRWREERRARLRAQRRRGGAMPRLREVLTGPFAASVAAAVARRMLQGPGRPTGAERPLGRPVGEA